MDAHEQPRGLNIVATLSVLCTMLALAMPTLLLAAGFVLALIARAERMRCSGWIYG